MHNKTLVFLLAVVGGLLAQVDESWKLFDDSQVANVYITVDQNDLDWIYAHVESDSLHPASIRYVNHWIDETVDSVGFRIRGNTSRHSAKKSFKIAFNAYQPGGEFYGVDKLNLNGEHNDPSIIRSKLCWDLYQDIGMAASRANHVRVYINGNYYGLYISVEHVDDEFLDKNFTDDSGNLWKCIWPADLTYRGDDPANYHPYYGDERPYELKTNEDIYDYSALARLIGILEKTSDGDLPDSLEAVLDVAGVLKYLAMNILTGSWDDYRYLKNNYYLYHEPVDDKLHLIPYDYDNTFSIDWFGIDWATVDPFEYPRNDSDPRPLSTRILDNDQYHNLFAHFLQFYNDNVFELSIWEERIDSLKNMIYSAAEDDSYRTFDYGFTMNDFNNSYTAYGYSDRHVKQGIKEFINQRSASLPSQLTWLTARPIVYSMDWQPRNPGATDSIRVTVAAFSAIGLRGVVVQYHPGYLTVIEEYPMDYSPVTASKIVEESDRWTVTLPPLGEGGHGRFQVVAIDNNGQNQLYPRTSFITLQAPGALSDQVVINEFLAKNDACCTDPAGELDDWVELYNPTDEVIDLANCWLTDNLRWLNKWQFPETSTPINPGGYLVVWCDEDGSQGDLHANFKLSASGEFLALTRPDSVTVIDSLSFGVQSSDISYGRIPDGSTNWDFLSPTLAAANAGVGIDEFYAPKQWNLAAFPNPFNAQVRFQIDIPETGKLRMTVFDIRGRQVATIKPGWAEPGVYFVDWRPADDLGRPIASGVLLVRTELIGLDGSIVHQAGTKLLYLK